MGILLSRLKELWDRFGNRQAKILLVGLDGAGKTTFLYKLKLGEVITTIPTIGFNVESVQYKSITCTCWDVGGQTKIRPLWRYYFENSDCVIFVIDSSDRQRIKEAKEELDALFAEDTLRNAIFLILANKQDLPMALPPGEMIDLLELSNQRKQKWFVQSCCAHTGDGIYEGLDWLEKNLPK
ncbi:unnamed protein product, partial [Mesorhabditis belari]|uniref:ADP-ribosylation factor n=1 Tax=Mesorhabditis belari TaxID=2138241 RepID=A0AAF3EU27_9BILA